MLVPGRRDAGLLFVLVLCYGAHSTIHVHIIQGPPLAPFQALVTRVDAPLDWHATHKAESTLRRVTSLPGEVYAKTRH